MSLANALSNILQGAVESAVSYTAQKGSGGRRRAGRGGGAGGCTPCQAQAKIDARRKALFGPPPRAPKKTPKKAASRKAPPKPRRK